MRRWLSAAIAGLAFGIAGAATAQTGPGIVMAAYGGGNGETWRKMMGEPFAAATGQPVRIADLPNTEAAIRASAGAPQYNVAWVGYFQAANLYKDGLIETFDTADFPELAHVDPKFLLKAPDGKLVGIPVHFQYYGIAYNTEQAKASDFPSWLSLGEPKWKGKLAQGQAFVAASYDLMMYAQIAGGGERDTERGQPEFEKFARNALTIMTSFAQGNTLLSRGEIAATPFYSARIRALKKEKAPVDIVIPKEGAVMLPYMLVVPKGAKNRDSYMAFLKAATETAGQVRMYDYSGYIPLNGNSALNAEQAAELGMPLMQLAAKLYQPDYWRLSENMKKNTELVERIQAGR